VLEVLNLHLLRGAILLLCTFTAWAGPRELGLQAYDAALRARGLKPERHRIRAVLDAGPPESFRITGQTIYGGDLRGLMYGLFEAAHQMREHGRLRDTTASPALAVRAVRLNRADLPTGDDLRSLLALLASSRFNTLFIVPEPPRDLRPLAAQFGLKLAPPDTTGLLDVELPVASTAIPWADPVSVSRLLADADLQGFHGFVIPARLPFALHKPFYAVWGLIGHGAEDSSKRWASLLSDRFGSSAGAAWSALSLASRCLTFIPPQRFLLSPAETTAQPATARYTPLQLATAYHLLARDAEDALLPLKTELAALQPLIDYGRMKARELLAAEAAAWYRATGHDSALYLAQRESKAAATRTDAVRAAGLPVAEPPAVAGPAGSTQAAPAWRPLPDPLPFAHVPPKAVVAGKPLTLSLRIPAASKASEVRLHYHDGGRFHTLESPASRPHFTLTPQGDLRYYFEVVSPSGSGWFYPDPLAGSPYFRLNVRPAPHP